MTPALVLAAALHVPVRLVNAADLPLHDVASLRGEAARLLAPAGVRLVWEGAPPLEVRLVECGRAAVAACPPGVLGRTVTHRHDPEASYAVICVDRVRRLSAHAPGLRGSVLARVLAHELVHLLAGPGAHDEGLMAPHWSAEALSAPHDPSCRMSERTLARIRAGTPRRPAD